MPLKGLNIDLAGEKGEDKESSEISQNLFDQPTIIDNASQKSNTNIQTMTSFQNNSVDSVSELGRDEGYTVKYTPLAEGVPKGKAQLELLKAKGYI